MSLLILMLLSNSEPGDRQRRGLAGVQWRDTPAVVMGNATPRLTTVKAGKVAVSNGLTSKSTLSPGRISARGRVFMNDQPTSLARRSPKIPCPLLAELLHSINHITVCCLATHVHHSTSVCGVLQCGCGMYELLRRLYYVPGKYMTHAWVGMGGWVCGNLQSIHSIPGVERESYPYHRRRSIDDR